MKQIVLLVFAFLFLLSTCLHTETPASAQTVNNPYELVVATQLGLYSVDPAWIYDSAYAHELIFNVFEPLIFFDGESIDEFVPMLATDWWISNDGLTYTFKVREGVKFHNGETLTTEDVEYSFERVMVHGQGSAWMLYDTLFNVKEANLTDPMFGQKIDNAIQRNDTHVWFKLARSYVPFPKILSQPWCSIVNKKFCVEHGDWPGTWDNWQDYYDPWSEYSPLDDPEPVMCGTGPFKLDDYLPNGKMEWSIVKFDNYWGGWPAFSSKGYVKRVTMMIIYDWLTRKTSFLNGYLDMVYVPRGNINEVFGQPGIRCVYPLPMLWCGSIFFNYNISLSSRYLRLPFTSYECDYGELNENGIPPDFFSDVDVRKGFAYSINYTEFLQAACYGEALYPGNPAITGLPYRNPEQEKYEFNLTKAEEHFKKAWNGQLWTTGFILTVSYNVGNVPRKVIGRMLKANVESLNPKFHIELLEYEMGTLYIPEMFAGELPLFQIDWYCDYLDLHSVFYNFMHSKASYPTLQRYVNPTVDPLIDEALHTMNETKRREIYYELQQIYFDECPSITIDQPVKRHWERTWVQGWHYNIAYAGLYFYPLWKQDLPPEDLNIDGTVNVPDLFVAAKAFGSYCALPDVHPRWNSRADFNQDQNVDIRDIAAVASRFGSQTVPWQPP